MEYKQILQKLTNCNSQTLDALRRFLGRNTTPSRACNAFLNFSYFASKAIKNRHLPKCSAPNTTRDLADYGNAQKPPSKKVCIIAELSIQQCTYYRVEQRIQQLRELGLDAHVVSWTEQEKALDALQDACCVIFYRTPFFDGVQALYREAKRLGLTIFYEVDDLIFDLEQYRQNSNLTHLSSREIKILEDGVLSYRQALLAADRVIVSTEELRQHVALLEKPAFVVHNALADRAIHRKPPCSASDRVSLYYGSGTKTHDEDFLEVSDALCHVLEQRDNVDIYIHGTLQLPECLHKFSERIYCIGKLAIHDYYRAIAEYDIALCPLKQTAFNDGKSNIKFLEAAASRTPAVCSPVAEFRNTIQHGENGLLAHNAKEWADCLLQLIDNPELRLSMGERAYTSAVEHYSIAAVANNEVRPCFESVLDEKSKYDVMLVNILFGKNSFGGATIVVESLAAEFIKKGLKVCVFTTIQDQNLPEYSLVRYEHNGTDVFALVTHSIQSEIDDNERAQSVFERVLRSIRCDRVHFHSIQHLGTGLTTVCKQKNIPYFITIHDAWWWCPRQFMIDTKGEYCNQKACKSSVCSSRCNIDFKALYSRKFRMEDALNGAERIFTPSDFFTELAQKNTRQQKAIVSNKNGILSPSEIHDKHSDNPRLTFAYVGGVSDHKGYYFLKECLKSVDASRYKLILPDIHKLLGSSAIKASDWDNADNIHVVSPYTEKTMDSFYSAVDVLIFPSLWDESFGLTVREAIARNVFVIASECGGPSECIVHGANGLLFPKGDIAACTECIEYALSNASTLKNYSTTNFGDIRSYETQALELIGHYNEC